MQFALSLLLASSLVMASHLSSDQIKKQMKEPGHIPQGLKPRIYHPLSELISKEKQQKLKENKKTRKTKQASLWDWIFPSAYADPSPIESSTPNDEIPDSVDLRKYDSLIRNQWDGTCTAHGMIETIENLLNRKTPTLLSVRYFWNQYRQYSAEVAVQTASQTLQIEDQYWPEGSPRPKVNHPSQYGAYQLERTEYLEDDTDAVLEALAEGYPVYIAMQVPSDMASCRSTIRYSTAVVNGGHALAIVGYELDDSIQGGGYFILKNSWGTDCGDQGYQYMPIGLCSRQDMYCLFWSIEKAEKVK